MDTNARVDYFRSEIKGEIEKLRKELTEQKKSADGQILALQQKLDGALRELRRI